jgi:hypothetical protein
MKLLCVMILSIVSATNLLAGVVTTQSDEELRKAIVGTWNTQFRRYGKEVYYVHNYMTNGKLHSQGRIDSPKRGVTTVEERWSWKIDGGVLSTKLEYLKPRGLLPVGTETRVKIIFSMDGEAFKLITKEGGKGGNVEIHHRVKSQSEVKAGELTESRSASGGKDKNLGCQLNSPKASDKYDAKRGAAKWRSLFLMKGLIASSTWCIEKLGIKTPEAVALVRAFDAVKKSPLSTKAEEAEKKVHQLAEKIARTEQGQRKIAAYKNLSSAEEQGYSRGQPTWERALGESQTAHDAAYSTPLGRSLKKATQDAEDARMKVNKSKEMGTAVEAYKQYNCAIRARFSTASPEEQTKLSNDLLSCHESWGADRMKQALQHMGNPFDVRFGL